MKNWKYINGAEVDNEGLSLWEKLKTAGKDHITMKSPRGEEAKINKDGDVTYKKDDKSQLVLDKHSSFEKAVEAYKAKGFKFGNSDGVARMFEGLVKDENKEVEKDSEAIEDLEKVGNSAFDDGAKKGKEDKRKGKLITMAGFEMHAPGYSNLSFKEKEEYRKGYYSTNDLTKDDIYKQWKTGNSASEYEILKQDPSKMHPEYKKAYEEALKKLSKENEEMRKRFEREYGVKAKNETSDDKFAYVMREFDEGKLKSSSGETVTNPEQAKAIAYSESKKTENGLARARKAIH